MSRNGNIRNIVKERKRNEEEGIEAYLVGRKDESLRKKTEMTVQKMRDAKG